MQWPYFAGESTRPTAEYYKVRFSTDQNPADRTFPSAYGSLLTVLTEAGISHTYQATIHL